MGDFRATIEAVGGHGCQRELKDGSDVPGCGAPTCPDCIIGACVAKLRKAGCNVKSAQLVHWPGQASEVVDVFEPDPSGTLDIAARKRIGSF